MKVKKMLLMVFATMLLLNFTFIPQTYAATISIPAGYTQAQIQSVINSASSGDVISFASTGAYHFTGPLTLKNGITIDGNNSQWIGDSSTNVVRIVDTAALQNVTIREIRAWNLMIKLAVSGTAYTNINNITIDSVSFSDGKREPERVQVDSYYMLVKANDVTVQNCKFLRKSTYPGRGILLYLAQNCTIQNNLFGTTSSSNPDPSTYGYFKTAVNMCNDSVIVGECLNNSILDNYIYRSLSMDDAISDHGMYLHGFNGITVDGNIVNGWPASAAGGGLKLRNGKNATVSYNNFVRSGILTYVYESHPLKYLQNVNIHHNTITLQSWSGTPDGYHGISFWRNYSPAANAEKTIRIANNTINKGCIFIPAPVNVSDFNYNNGTIDGGVFNNTINTGAISLVSGIDNSGNIIN